MRFRTVAAVAAFALGVMTVGACGAEPGVAPPDPWPQAAGCYQVGGWADIQFTGQKNVLGNAAYLVSSDGSCTGAAFSGDAGSNTIVEATSFAEAQSLCDSLAGVSSPHYFPTAASSTLTPSFPIANAWTCV